MILKPTPSLKISFCLSLFCTLFFPLFFPHIHLFFFVPYLIVCFYRLPKLAVLWRALGCGIILDLLSSAPFFGFTSLNYCLVSWILYSQTRNFFEDKLGALPLLTFLFSLFSTALSYAQTFFFGKGFSITGMWVATDLIIMPLADASYALLVFSLPFQVIYRLKKIRLRS